MNKRLIITIGLPLLIIGALISFWYYNQSTTLVIESSDSDFEINLTTVNEQHTIKPNQSARLKKQQYEMKIISDKYIAPAQTIQLNQPTTIKLDLDFSQEFASKTFPKDINHLRSTIQAQYPTIQVDRVLFYQRGQYAIVTLHKPPQQSNSHNISSRIRSSSSRPIFKIIFKKNNNNWTPLNQPELVFYHKNYPQIPKTILQSANDILNP